jgi:hypothetical protein
MKNTAFALKDIMRFSQFWILQPENRSGLERVRLKSIRGLAPGVKREQFLQLRLPGFQPAPQKRLASGDFFTVRADDFLVCYFQRLFPELGEARRTRAIDSCVARHERPAYGAFLIIIFVILSHRFSFRVVFSKSLC